MFKRVLQEFGEERALDTMGIMLLGTIIDLDRQIAIDAAKISNERKLAMADSIILATARAYSATLWTQDEHFKGIEGVRYKAKKPRKRFGSSTAILASYFGGIKGLVSGFVAERIIACGE